MAPRLSFEERVQQLIAFEEENGHMFVPHKYSCRDNLGKWAANKRAEKKAGKLNEEQVEELDTIGFPWEILTGPAKDELIEWGKQFRWLMNYHKAKGHCNVPATIAGKAVPAAAWCDVQRQLYMDGKLDQGKIDKLTKIGFDFFASSEGDEGENEQQPATKRQRADGDSEIYALKKDLEAIENKLMDEIQKLRAQLLK